MSNDSIPLTNTYIPESSCLRNVYRLNASYSFTSAGETTTYQYVRLGPKSLSTCYPKGFAITSQHFSPGICPSGYTQACSTVEMIGANTETRATCCPSFFACQTTDVWPWYSTEACTRAKLPSSMGITMTSFIKQGLTSTFVSTIAGGLNAYGISIRYQAADFATITSASTSSAPFTGPSPTSSSASSASPTASDANSSPLGGGAIAGIVIGIIFALVVLASITFLFRNSRKKRSQMQELEGRGQDYQQGIKYQPVAPPVEMQASPAVPHELDSSGTQIMAELPGYDTPQQNQVK